MFAIRAILVSPRILAHNFTYASSLPSLHRSAAGSVGGLDEVILASSAGSLDEELDECRTEIGGSLSLPRVLGVSGRRLQNDTGYLLSQSSDKKSHVPIKKRFSKIIFTHSFSAVGVLALSVEGTLRSTCFDLTSLVSSFSPVPDAIIRKSRHEIHPNYP